MTQDIKMNNRDLRVKELLDGKVEALRISILNKLSMRRSYTSKELKVLFRDELTLLLTMAQMSTFTASVKDYSTFLNIKFSKTNDYKYVLSTKNIIPDECRNYKAPVVETTEQIENYTLTHLTTNPSEVILNSYLGIVNSWNRDDGIFSSNDYIKALERISTLVDCTVKTEEKAVNQDYINFKKKTSQGGFDVKNIKLPNIKGAIHNKTYQYDNQ